MRWTEERIASEIRSFASGLGRMPTSTELYELGRGDLLSAMHKKGGQRAWAVELGLKLKPSCSTAGHNAELYVAEKLRSMGHHVTHQTWKSPFDLLLNGNIRVDVKWSAFHRYPHASDPVNGIGGYFFSTKKNARCDLYVLCCAREAEAVSAVYVVPSVDAVVDTITLVGDGSTSKYAQYREAWHLLGSVYHDLGTGDK